MSAESKQVIEECTTGSHSGVMTFPEVVGKLAGIGCESYTVDVLSQKQTLYGADGAVHEISLPLLGDWSVPIEFNQPAVKDALVKIQTKQSVYMEFMRQIVDAGVAKYEVFIQGRKVIYLGRNGDFHIENFPTAATVTSSPAEKK